MADNVSSLNAEGDVLINNCLWNIIHVSELDDPFDGAELDSSISNLKTGKSHANDYLLNELFVHSNAVIKLFILKLFNTILQT